MAASALAENQQMSDKLNTTARIQRPAKLESDGRGRSVWAEPVGTAEFKLLYTVELRKILKDEDVDEPVAEEPDHAGFDPYDSS